MAQSYDFFLLLKEAHNHGRGCVDLWGEQKSFNEFLKQYNLINEYNNHENRKSHPELAKSLRKKGYTIRGIANILGYRHPGSVTNLLKR